MKLFNLLTLTAVLAAALVSVPTSSLAGSGGARGSDFIKMKYFCPGGSGSGGSSGDCAASTDHTKIMDVEAGVVMCPADVVVTTAVTGSSPQILVGDGDNDDGYIDSGDVTEATPGWYHSNTSGGYVDSGACYAYTSAKTIYLETTGTLSAGAFVVVLHGYRF